MTYYRERYGLAPESLPEATRWSRRALTLPLHPQMTEEDVEDVSATLSEAFSHARVTA
jgi:perosamine synthetase